MLRRVAEAARNVLGERLFPDPEPTLADIDDDDDDEELDELDSLFEYQWEPLTTSPGKTRGGSKRKSSRS